MSDSASPQMLEPIAIIGMSGRFPGANNPSAYWQNLERGVRSITSLSSEQLLAAGISPELFNAPNYVNAVGLLDNVDQFDASFFRFAPSEAELTDPQQRLALECAWEAFEDAGYVPGSSRSPVAVFLGSSLSTYLIHNFSGRRDLVNRLGLLRVLIGNDKDHVPTTIAHLLDLKGPCMNVSTGCSSSLVAICMACQSLWSYESGMALAGGVSIQVPHGQGHIYQAGGVYSPDGFCRAFDRRAGGTIGGSGVGLVLLKRLPDALADGDHIYATILGCAINNDGADKVGYTAPSVSGQTAVISDALAVARVNPESISYVEAHGTGTAVGDPIEITALTQAFRRYTDKREYCALGSVKPNIGHLDTAAGIASLIKVALSLEHQQLPASLHYEEPNPELNLSESPFYVPTHCKPWVTNGHSRRAAVSSFGMGGTNAHVILEEAPAIHSSSDSRPYQVLTLSAKTRTALGAAIRNLISYLEQHKDVPIADIAFTLSVGRTPFEYRNAVICRDATDGINALNATIPALANVAPQRARQIPVAFLFAGLSTVPWNLGYELYTHEPVFRESFERCATRVQIELGSDLRKRLRRSQPNESREPVAAIVAQVDPFLFAFQYALAQTWISWGVHPNAMIGEGSGEYVAACLAGVLTLDDALDAVILREKSFTQISTFADFIRGVPLQRPQIPYVSNVTGTWITDSQATDPDYWVRQSSQAQAFNNGLRQLFADPERLVLNVSPDKSLHGLAKSHANASQLVLSSCSSSSEQSELQYLLSTLTHLWMAGVEVDWQGFYAKQQRRRVPLPTYPFERRRYWVDPVLKTQKESAAATEDKLSNQDFNSLVRFLKRQESELEKELAVNGIESYEGLEEALNKLCASHAYWFLREFGLPEKGEEGRSYEEIRARLSVTAPYQRFFDYLLELLAHDGLVEISPNGVVRTLSDSPPRPAALEAKIKQLWSGFDGLLELLAHAVQHYRQLFASAITPTNVLYPEGKGDLLKRTLLDCTVEHTRTRFYARVVRELLINLAAESKRTLRILEVGVGAGGLTWEVVPALQNRAINYHATDVSRAFVSHVSHAAQERGLSLMTFGTLDISTDPLAQGYSAESYDVILGLDVVHATPNIPETIRHLRQLLAPFGILALIETVRSDRWTNMIWGVSDAWWSFNDEIRSTTPLLSVDEWKRVLGTFDFESICTLPDSEAQADKTDTALLLLQKREAEKTSTDVAAQLPAREPDIADWLYVPSWERVPTALPQHSSSISRRWLFFVDERGVAHRFIAALRKRGDDVITVTHGQTFDRRSSGEFCIDPSIEEHYSRMLGDLAHTGCPENIVHCWSVTTDASTEELQNLGLFSLIALAKAIGSHGINTPINITVLANGLHEVLGDEHLVPIKNTLLGPVKIIPREYPNIFCRSIDLALTGQDAMSTEALDTALRIICDDQTNPILALRGTTFWRQTFLPIHLPRSDRSPLPKNGVYLVIGGLGAIGLNLALSLANASASCLVLTSRTPFPPISEWDRYLSAHPETDEVSRKIKKLKTILARGVNVILRSVDVTSREDMSSLVKEIRERYGALHGVIHAAGVPDTGGIIQLRSREDTEHALRAKVNGLLVLDQVLGDEPLDLLVLCSSIGSTLYHLKFGEVGYVVANDFVNAFARSFARRRHTLTVAINWTDWKEGGMWSDAQKRLQQKYESFPGASRDTEAELGTATSFISDLLLGISDAEAAEVFERALTQTSPELIVSTQNLTELLARHASFTSKSHESFLENVQLVKPAHERSTLSTPYVAPRTKTERHLAEIWQELLGIARVGIDDDFFDLGGDSLLAIRVLNRLHEDFQIDQTLASLMELPTVQKLAAHVDEFTSKRVMNARPAASGTTEEVLI